MLAVMFPQRLTSSPASPIPIVLVVRLDPPVAIRQVLALSIHDVVNDPEHKRTVLDFYRISRRIENEAWLRRALQERANQDWIAAHL